MVKKEIEINFCGVFKATYILILVSLLAITGGKKQTLRLVKGRFLSLSQDLYW